MIVQEVFRSFPKTAAELAFDDGNRVEDSDGRTGTVLHTSRVLVNVDWDDPEDAYEYYGSGFDWVPFDVIEKSA